MNNNKIYTLIYNKEVEMSNGKGKMITDSEYDRIIYSHYLAFTDGDEDKDSEDYKKFKNGYWDFFSLSMD